jgi:hypothetical protein
VYAVSRKVRLAVADRLADDESGFNPWLAEACEEFDVTIRPVSFASSSRQFWQAAADPTLLEDTSITDYPLMFLYTLGSSNNIEQRPSTFSGPVSLALDIHLSFRNTAAMRDMESHADAVESALIKTLNHEDYFYSTGVAWNGRLLTQRDRLILAGESWLHSIRARMAFSVTV